MGGVEQRLSGAAVVRILAGPALFHTNDSNSKGGVQTRIDFSVPADKRVAFVVWGQNGFMHVGGNVKARVPMFGLGVRIQQKHPVGEQVVCRSHVNDSARFVRAFVASSSGRKSFA